MTSLDIVIPTFNAPADRLGRVLRSALACDDVGRVIIVDDGSSSSPTAKSFGLGADSLEKLVVLTQLNAGPSAARNQGLRTATADFILCVDDDDELIPKGVAAMVALADRLNAAGAVAARFNVKSLGPNVNSVLKDVPPEWAGRSLPDPADVFTPIALFGGSGILVHRRVPAEGIFFDESLQHGEDREFLRRVAGIGKLAVSAEPALRVAIHEGGTNLSSHSKFPRRIRDHVVVLDRYLDVRSQFHMRSATTWLLDAAAKARVDRESWSILLAACRKRGWSIPLKARLRRHIRGASA